LISSAHFIADAPATMGQRDAQSERTRIGHLSKLNIYSEPDDVRRTGIICTVGPKTGTVEMLTKLRRYALESHVMTSGRP
jgi:hypothetical protein